MSAKIRIAIVMLSAGIAFFAIVGTFPWDRGVTAQGNQWAQLRIFDEVLYHIIRDYVDEPDMERVRTGALRGLADGLDPYSAYLTPAQVAEFNAPDPGMAEVGGMAFSKYGGYIFVVSVLKNSPAERSGISAGDVIEYIGKTPSRDMSVYDARMVLRHQTGPTEFKIFRGGRSITVTYQQGPAEVPGVESKMIEGDVGYIAIPALRAGSANEVKSAVEALKAKGAKRMVLDLRGTALGVFEEGTAVADLFIDAGVLGRKIGRGGVDSGGVNATTATTVFQGPLSVVIDFSTAGAGEVIAAAVLEAKRGEVVGEKSFGAGGEQQLFKLHDGGALLLTVSKYAPASGKPFMEESVTPSTVVEVKQQTAELLLPEDDEGEAGDDEEDATDSTAAPKPAPKPAPAEDVQLKKAIELVRSAPERAAARAA